MRKVTRQIIYVSSWIVAVAALVAYFFYKPGQLEILLDTPISLLALLCALVGMTWFTVYLQSYLSIKAILPPPPFFEYLGVFFIGLLINYSPIRVGIAARAIYLSRFYNVKLSVFSAISTFRLLVMLFMSGLIACTSLLILNINLAAKTNFVVFVIFLSCLIGPILVFLSIRLGLWGIIPDKIYGWLQSFGSAFSQANNKTRLIVAICSLVFIQFLITALRMKICFEYADIQLDFFALMALAPLGTVLSIISITPGGIGVREFAVASMAVLLGYSFDQGMQALIIDRISMISIAIVFGILGFGLATNNRKQIKS